MSSFSEYGESLPLDHFDEQRRHMLQEQLKIRRDCRAVGSVVSCRVSDRCMVVSLVACASAYEAECLSEISRLIDLFR